jgi:glyoxylate reductase
MTHRILITAQLPDETLELLLGDPLVSSVDVAAQTLSSEDLHKAFQTYDAVITLLSDQVSASMLEDTSVRVIANYAVGYNNIDIDAAKKNGVVVTNTPGVLTDASADLAFSLLMSVARRIPEADRYCRAGKFVGWGPMLMLGADIAHQTIGILGAGRIGTAMARRALGFNMNILYTSRSQKPDMDDMGAKRVLLTELLSQSDFVSLHTSLNESTHHLIDAGALSEMKKSAFLINTSRGSVVDEVALVEALEKGEIAGAGLDVFEEEPKIHPALLTMEQVVMAPHIGSGTTRTRRVMAEMVAHNVLAALGGTSIPNPVF